jgi:hypothetical protein
LANIYLSWNIKWVSEFFDKGHIRAYALQPSGNWNRAGIPHDSRLRHSRSRPQQHMTNVLWEILRRPSSRACHSFSASNQCKLSYGASYISHSSAFPSSFSASHSFQKKHRYTASQVIGRLDNLKGSGSGLSLFEVLALLVLLPWMDLGNTRKTSVQPVYRQRFKQSTYPEHYCYANQLGDGFIRYNIITFRWSLFYFVSQFI